MDGKNLAVKFALLLLVAGLCVSFIVTKELKQGIDLRGGHSLIYEIVTNKAKIKQLKDERAEITAKLNAAASEEEKASLSSSIESIDAEILDLEQGDSDDLANRMIQVLKRRVDPLGLRNLQWRPSGEGRIEVRMPAAMDKSKEARQAYQREINAMRAGNITDSQIGRVERAKAGPQRDEEIATLAKDDNVLASLLEKLGEARDAVDAVDRSKDDEAYQNALAAWENIFKQVKRHNVSLPKLQGVLDLYLTKDETRILEKKNKKELKKRNESFEQSLNGLLAEYPTRKNEIEAVLARYKAWAAVRQHLDDPADLKRLIAKAGVLEFRIAPRVPTTDAGGFQLTQPQWQQYIKDLEDNGPQNATKQNMPFQWFPMQDPEAAAHGLVTAEYAGKTYMLLCNQPENTMLQSGSQKGWSLSAARPWRDEYNSPSVLFTFDERGAARFGMLTAAHIGHALTVLLDDEVYSFPNIREVITKTGTISGNFTPIEVADLVRTLEAGSLPARLNPIPVAESTFGPGIGKVNREQGIRAAYWAMIAVALFMLIYYVVPGCIADIALMLNIVLVLGAMSMMEVVFTLPGIAGVILTIGIAVDANVLIFERLREEQARGQSIRMAVKNAYSRAFSAIFDANLTTMIICLILFWMGTEEIKGFAITLGLGVAFSMFTALLVTRWLFQLLIATGLMKKPAFMLHIIGVPKIDWMGKRRWFWGLSVVLIVIGVVALTRQGKDLLGIEFSSGTSAVISLKDDAIIDGKLPTDAAVRASILGAAAELGDDYEKFRTTAMVEMLIDQDKVEKFLKRYDSGDKLDGKVSKAEWLAKGFSEKTFAPRDANGDGFIAGDELESLPATSYQITTTESDISIIKKSTQQALSDSLERRLACKFDLVKNRHIEELGIDIPASGRARVQKMDESRYREALDEYKNGSVVIVENVSPALTIDELKTRIEDMRAQADFETLGINKSLVMGREAAGTGKYSSFIVFVSPNEELNPTAWEYFADQELALLETALASDSAMVARNFDPELAGDNAAMALIAIALSWLAIVGYLWFRFGSARWGLAAVICLVHDVVIVVGLVALAGWVHNSFIGQLLGLAAFKIDVPMIAAILTVIGYSVNDTIVVFDRIRENRGRLTSVSAQVINVSVNQTLSRTFLTSGTTFIVVLIMYVWGGPAIHAFNYALLAGIIFGTYSSVAIASPLLLGFKEAMVGKVTTERIG